MSEQVQTDELGRRHLERLVMLSDGVFAIAITLAALEIRPQHAPGQSLAQAWLLPVLVYLVAFALVGGAWNEHRQLMARLTRIDATGILLNMLMLGSVALLPVTVREFMEDPATANALIYACTTLLTYALLSLSWAHATLAAKLAPQIDRRFAMGRLLKMLAAPTMLLAIICYLLQLPWLALLIALLAVMLGGLSRRYPRTA
ncbi:MAG: TMEM175 family protein [Pseudoxanthomonas sp.]